MGASEVHRTIEAVWRIESGRVVAGLAGLVRDVGLAEELAQDALVAALERWPREGVPDNPGAWLMAVGKRRAIDALRRRQTFDRKLTELGRNLDDDRFNPDFDAAFDDNIEDDLLRLVFTACHPVLSAQARAAAGADRLKRATLLLDPAATVRAVQFPVTDPAGSVSEMLRLVRDRVPVAE